MSNVLLDTSFFIRLLDDTDSLHKNALGYFRYYLENDIQMHVSTISIAEYCVRGELDELPLKDIRIIPFNIDHSQRSGKFAETLFRKKQGGDLDLSNRLVIPNDCKIFSQTDLNSEIVSFVTSDSKASKPISILKAECGAKFDIVDINVPVNETYGFLDL